MSGTKKKLVIKPFRPNAQWDAQKAHGIWNALSSAIKEIHKEHASDLSFEELYRNAYNLVLQKHGDLLYEGVSEQVKQHLRAVGETVAQASDDELLKVIDEAWRKHTNARNNSIKLRWKHIRKLAAAKQTLPKKESMH